MHCLDIRASTCTGCKRIAQPFLFFCTAQTYFRRDVTCFPPCARSMLGICWQDGCLAYTARTTVAVSRRTSHEGPLRETCLRNYMFGLVCTPEQRQRTLMSVSSVAEKERVGQHLLHLGVSSYTPTWFHIPAHTAMDRDQRANHLWARRAQVPAEAREGQRGNNWTAPDKNGYFRCRAHDIITHTHNA